MHRVIAIAVAGASLAGCSSFSLDSFKSAPPLVKVALESAPPGADATTSLGPACKTPCAIDVPAPDAGFSVTFAMPKFQPVTVPVQVIRNPGDYASAAQQALPRRNPRAESGSALCSLRQVADCSRLTTCLDCASQPARKGPFTRQFE